MQGFGGGSDVGFGMPRFGINVIGETDEDRRLEDACLWARELREQARKGLWEPKEQSLATDVAYWKSKKLAVHERQIVLDYLVTVARIAPVVERMSYFFYRTIHNTSCRQLLLCHMDDTLLQHDAVEYCCKEFGIPKEHLDGCAIPEEFAPLCDQLHESCRSYHPDTYSMKQMLSQIELCHFLTEMVIEGVFFALFSKLKMYENFPELAGHVSNIMCNHNHRHHEFACRMAGILLGNLPKPQQKKYEKNLVNMARDYLQAARLYIERICKGVVSSELIGDICMQQLYAMDCTFESLDMPRHFGSEDAPDWLHIAHEVAQCKQEREELMMRLAVLAENPDIIGEQVEG